MMVEADTFICNANIRPRWRVIEHNGILSLYTQSASPFITSCVRQRPQPLLVRIVLRTEQTIACNNSFNRLLQHCHLLSFFFFLSSCRLLRSLRPSTGSALHWFESDPQEAKHTLTQFNRSYDLFKLLRFSFQFERGLQIKEKKRVDTERCDGRIDSLWLPDNVWPLAPMHRCAAVCLLLMVYPLLWSHSKSGRSACSPFRERNDDHTTTAGDQRNRRSLHCSETKSSEMKAERNWKRFRLSEMLKQCIPTEKQPEERRRG